MLDKFPWTFQRTLSYKPSFSLLSSNETGRELGCVAETPWESLIIGCFQSLENRLHKNTTHFLAGLYNTHRIVIAIMFLFLRKIIQCKGKAGIKNIPFTHWFGDSCKVRRQEQVLSPPSSGAPALLCAIMEKGNIGAFFSPCKREKMGVRGLFKHTSLTLQSLHCSSCWNTLLVFKSL